MRLRWAFLGLAFVAACADPSRVGDTITPRYEVSTTVLENAEHGPELCLGFMNDSLPPQCGGPTLVGWDWNEVDGEERIHGTTWGTYHVVGIYDGTTFTLTEKPKPPQPEPAPTPVFRSACTEPPTGWPTPDPAKDTTEGSHTAGEYARAQPDFAGVWIVHPNPTADPPVSDGIVLNVAFTGDLSRHEAEIRKDWGGALCLVEREHSWAELDRIRNEKAGLDLDALISSIDDQTGTVELTVITFEPEDQQTLDERYGKGLVRLTAILKKID